MKSTRFFLNAAGAALVGIGMLGVLLFLGYLFLDALVEVLYPPLPLCGPAGTSTEPCYTPGPMFDLGQNFDKHLTAWVIYYYLSTLTAGFVAGRTVGYLEEGPEEADGCAGIGQSLLAGMVVGMATPLIPFFIGGGKRADSFWGMAGFLLVGMLVAALLGLPAPVSSFLGYKFRWKRMGQGDGRWKSTGPFLLALLAGTAVYLGLVWVFDFVVHADCTAPTPTPGIIWSACTESWIAFGLILTFSAFLAGWLVVDRGQGLVAGLLAGLAVGGVGPWLETIAFGLNNLALAFLFYAAWGGITALLGGTCRQEFLPWFQQE